VVPYPVQLRRRARVRGEVHSRQDARASLVAVRVDRRTQEHCHRLYERASIRAPPVVHVAQDVEREQEANKRACDFGFGAC
jgi:hypothetical protein